MKIRGLGRLRGTTQQIQKQFAPKGLILMYHRVAEVDLDPWRLCVTPQNFAEHLEVLQKYAHPISLKQLAQAHREGSIPHKAVAVTFDDGYADNLHQAKPLLEQYNIPATIFVTTGYIGRNREFWWDELERLLLQREKLPEKLCLKLNGTIHNWELGTAVHYSEEDYNCDRNTLHNHPSPRLNLFYSIWQQLLPLQEGQRLKALDEIIVWANGELLVRSTHRALLADELCMLAQGNLVDIGAHTVNHPFLSTQSTDLQRDEIIHSKANLEEILARPVTSFAYPFGNYSSQTVNLVREAEFACACSTVEDVVWQKSDSFQLPRFQTHNWTGEEFTQRLLGWFNDNSL